MRTDYILLGNIFWRLKYCFSFIQAPWSIPGHRPPQSWPQHGEVKVANLSVRYRPEMDLVLKNISFAISAGEKVKIIVAYVEHLSVYIVLGLIFRNDF